MQYVSDPQRLWSLSRFGLKTGIGFEHFGLKFCMVIGETFAQAYKLIFLPAPVASNLLVREKEKWIKDIIPAKFYLFIFVTLTSVQY